jgi:hypothetical protein
VTDTQPRKKPGPKPAVSKKPAETKAERELRNTRIFALFLGGNSEKEIGRYVNLTGPRVHQIIRQELEAASRHRQLLTDEALAIYVGRLETLIKACWPKVAAGDLKAIETGRKLVEQMGRLYNVAGERLPSIPPGIEQELLGEDSTLDELTKFRLRRRPEAQ